jgi:BrnA antitoxin of type II toxin-antitoxin system
MLDLDVLDFFRARAAKRGADAYQTQINRALREYMASAGAKTDRRGDERFISQFAERVASYVVQRRRRRARPSRRARARPARA